MLPALDPGHAPIEERTPLDLLAFAQRYAAELVYYDAEDQPHPGYHDEDGEPHAGWSEFLPKDPASLAALAALVEGPPAGAAAEPVDRPHLALFLAFLRLLRHPRDLINGFTQRHLEHYYEGLLRMTRKPAVPDHVHVLVRLANGAAQARLPAGTLLRAGKDDLGRERVYRTDRELVVSRAAVARLSSVYAQTEVVGLREARERHKGTRDEAFIKALELALGDPRPGDPLPLYAGKAVTTALLQGLAQRIAFADAALFMDFADLRAVMTLQRQRAAATGEWEAINQALEKIGQARTGDRKWKLAPADPRAFAANLQKALGAPLDFEHDGLPDVDSLQDLHEQRLRGDVRDFIAAKLFMSVRDFEAMMARKLRIDAEWQEIDRILEQAGRRKRGKAFRLEPSLPPTNFAARLDAAVGPLVFAGLAHPSLPAIADIEGYYDAIVALEGYFRMSAAQLGYVLAVAAKPAGVATDAEWRKVERLLTEAHQDKVRADRREALRRALEDDPDRAAGFVAMLRIVLGVEVDGPAPTLPQLQPLLAGPGDEAVVAAFKAALAGGMPAAADRARIYDLLELAWRAREQLPAPVPRRATWLALHAAADAPAIVAGPDDPEAAPRRWKTFGQRVPELAADARPPGKIGWAIASPTLLLGQGTRTVALTLGFRARRFDAARVTALFASPETNPFELEISTAKGWLALAIGAVTVGEYKALAGVSRDLPEPLAAIRLTATIDEAAPPTAAPTAAAAAGVTTSWPLLRLRLRPLWDAGRRQHVEQYEALRDLLLAAAHLRTDVAGLVPSAIQSDEAVLAAKKPFEPFGASPAVGSRFHVGDPELVHKRIDRLTFRVEWRGVPADLTAHYAKYNKPDPEPVPRDYDPGPITAYINLIDDHVRTRLTDPAVALFNSNAATPRELVVEGIAARVEKPGLSYRYRSRADVATSGPVSTWPRRFEWELSPRDFGHQAYPAIATRKSLLMTAALVNKTPGFDPNDYQARPPYTPKIQSLRIDYTASTEVLAAGAAGVDRLFHVHPFGACPIAADADADGTPFLPRYDHAGELYIGLRDVHAPESVTLLFQLAEGVADPELAPVPVAWSYLSGDRWRTLHDGHLLADTTGGLTDAGVVQLALPPAEPNTRLPGDLYWLRVAIATNPDSVSDALAIRAQAVSATFVDRGNSPTHLVRKLQARSITGLVQRVAQVAAVEQPFPSRGGRPAEAQAAFYTRVSERLRHKQRALSPWDYERLVLERFPELYKAKCIPADARDPESLGVVTLVVIPAVHGQSTANPFEPKVPAALIAEITAFLAERSPPCAQIRVRNAHFVQVKVRAGVRFRGGGDDGFYRKLLIEELSRHLSPWAYDEGADVVIGGKIFANSIVSFLDSRDYVDYVATITLFSSDDGGRTFERAPEPTADGYFVATDRADGVLVAARTHEIDPISAAQYTGKSLFGINYMKIELDFVVSGSK